MEKRKCPENKPRICLRPTFDTVNIVYKNQKIKVQMKCCFISEFTKNQEDRRLPFLNISSSSRGIKV